MLQRVASKLKNDVYLINFEDERLINAKVEDLTTLSKLVNLNDSTVVLDEIQNIDAWEKWVRRHLEIGKTKFFITGSNASLLSGEYATLLTGRNKVITVFPLSFREYKKHTNRTFEEYLKEGGFPEPVFSSDSALTQQYKYDILYKDIISRYKIREVREIETLFFHILENPGIIASKKRLGSLVNISHVTLRKFLHYFTQTYAVYKIDKYATSTYEKENTPSKTYLVDNGLISKKKVRAECLKVAFSKS